jgi:PKD domain
MVDATPVPNNQGRVAGTLKASRTPKPEIVMMAPSIGLVGEEITFKATLTDGNKEDYIFAWSMGDGTKDVKGSTVKHSFRQKGPYAIEVVIYKRGDMTGLPKASYDWKINIYPPEPSELSEPKKL